MQANNHGAKLLVWFRDFIISKQQKLEINWSVSGWEAWRATRIDTGTVAIYNQCQLVGCQNQVQYFLY